jgi:LacI family transcriptional regulator
MSSDANNSADTLPRRIAVQMETGWIVNRHYGVLAGIYEFARTRPNWQVVVSRYPEVRMEQGVVFDGILGRIEPSLYKAAKKLNLPMVNSWLSSPIADKTTNVFADFESAGHMAAKHLIARGIRKLGFIELEGDVGTARLLRGVRDVAADSGATCITSTASLDYEESINHWRRTLTVVRRMLQEITAPFGLVTSSDEIARICCEVAIDAGWRIPEDVAVVSVGNDASAGADPGLTISSIDMGHRRVGYDAASALDRLMRGEEVSGTTYCKPKELMVRRTSDVFAVSDPEVAKALRFMADCADNAIGVPQITRVTKLSRQALQRRFRNAMGCTIHEELTRLRVERFKRLLADSDAPIRKLAADAGFGSEGTAYVVFQKVTGMTPAAYRESHANRKITW